jgi:hypothetical protein
VPQQEFDLLQIAAILSAEFGAGTAKVMGAKVFKASANDNVSS